MTLRDKLGASSKFGRSRLAWNAAQMSSIALCEVHIPVPFCLAMSRISSISRLRVSPSCLEKIWLVISIR